MQPTETIWTQYHKRLTAFIARRVSPSDAEDLAQEVFMKIASRIHTLTHETRIRSWIYQIARNTIIDFYRTRRPKEVLPEWIPAKEPGKDETATNELTGCLAAMIEQLPEMYRTAIHLSEIEDKTQRDIATQEGISLSGVKSRVRRGRIMLRAMLESCCTIELGRTGQPLDVDPRGNECGRC